MDTAGSTRATTKRISIDAPGYGHAAPIPAASSIGPLIASSTIAPFDPGTRRIPDDLNAQVHNVFHRAGVLLNAAAASWDDVIMVNFVISGPVVREVIDRFWVDQFPDASARPARQIVVGILPDKLMVQCTVLAYRPQPASSESRQ